MDNIKLGLELLVVGFSVVSLVLYLVVVVGKGLILFANRFPEKQIAVVKSNNAQINDTTKAVIAGVVKNITKGKGRIVNITKL